MPTKTKTKMHVKLELSKATKKPKLEQRMANIVIDARTVDKRLVEALMPALKELNANIAMLGSQIKSQGVHNAFSVEEALEEAHLWVVLTDKLPEEFNMLVERGVVPVMKTLVHKEAENYNPTQETGNAFLFDKLNEWQVYGAMIKALENYKFPYDWQNLKNNVKSFAKKTLIK